MLAIGIASRRTSPPPARAATSRVSADVAPAAAPPAEARNADPPGDAPERVVRGSAAIVTDGSIGREGNIDPARVVSIIRGQLHGIRSCYERALRNHPALEGRVEVRFTVGPSGRVTSASSSGLAEAPEVGTCVAARIRGLVFPQPEGGSVDFSFPFTFRPG